MRKAGQGTVETLTTKTYFSRNTLQLSKLKVSSYIDTFYELYLNKIAKEKKVSLFQYNRIPIKEHSNYRNHIINLKKEDF